MVSYVDANDRITLPDIQPLHKEQTLLFGFALTSITIVFYLSASL